jgi:hypothetical protein
MAKELATDPTIGVWKLDVDKSNFTLGPAPMGSVMKVEAWEDGLKMSADTIAAGGERIHPEIAYRFDGNDYSLTGSPVADSVSTRRINERKSESAFKKDGKITIRAKTFISSDGKTLTVMRRGRDAQGYMVDEVMVYERQ